MDLPELSVSTLEYDRGGSCVVVSLVGRAGIEDTAWFRRLLELQAAHGPGRIVIDLSRLLSMDWWAVLILLWVGRVISRRGGTLVLASPQPAVARLLRAAGASQIVTEYQRVQQTDGGAGPEPILASADEWCSARRRG